MITELEQIGHVSAQRNFCRDLAQTNLASCFIFAELAKRELETGMRGEAERSFGRAQWSYEAILRLLDRVENERSEVQKRVESLGEELDFLRQELNQAA
jgi:hypothetical protein